MSELLSLTLFLFLLLLPHLNNILTRRNNILVEGVIPPDPPVIITIKEDEELDYDRFYTKEYHVRRRRASNNPRSTVDSSICETVSAITPAIREEYSLDPFYEKYTHTHGIPILSSGQVSDTALSRACYCVRFLMADRADIRDALYNGHARVSILGTNEQTTEIPEYRYLDDSWNERTRGLGGTPQNPVTVVAEENLLCEDALVDRWWEEDIMVHEFVHAIHLIALDAIDATFKGRLKDAFLHAYRTGIWSDHYGGTNMNEYLAEGAQSFFNANAHREFIDNIHNNISNREALHDYDLELFHILLEIFPCANLILDRCSNQSLTTYWPLREDCPSHPSTSPTETSPTSSTSEESVETTRASPMSKGRIISTSSDTASTTSPSAVSSERRDSFAAGTRSPGSVSTSTTGVYESLDATKDIKGECADIMPLCSDLMSYEECIINPFKRGLCSKTCRSCSGCHDYHRLCANLSERGFCTTKAEFMESHCPKSCRVC